MRSIALLSAALVFGLAFQAFAADDNAEVTPGQQVLKQAQVSKAIGNPRRGTGDVDKTQQDTIDYWFFFPSDESAKTDDGYPLMLFMHGAGERGDDPKSVLIHGPAKLCANPETSKTWKFITVSPQCKDHKDWSPLQMLELIDQICAAYPVDKSRIYVTGLSMGGFGTWGVAAIASDRIAAAVPICGWFDVSKAAQITTPIWAFHGDADQAVKVESGYAITNAVKEAGNKDVQFTVYPGVPHDSWTRTYDNPELYTWLLSKSLKK